MGNNIIMGNNISVFGDSCPRLSFFGKKKNINNTQEISNTNLPPFIITPLIKNTLYDLSFNNL
jgi:hypothetical protein